MSLVMSSCFEYEIQRTLRHWATPLTEIFIKVMVFWPYASELHDGICRIQPHWSMAHGAGGLQVRICRPWLLSLGLSDRWAVRLDVVICSADPCQLCSMSAPIKFTNGGGLYTHTHTLTHTHTHIEMCVSPLQISTFYISEDYGNPLPFTSHPLLLCVCVRACVRVCVHACVRAWGRSNSMKRKKRKNS